MVRDVSRKENNTTEDFLPVAIQSPKQQEFQYKRKAGGQIQVHHESRLVISECQGKIKSSQNFQKALHKS